MELVQGDSEAARRRAGLLIGSSALKYWRRIRAAIPPGRTAPEYGVFSRPWSSF